MAPSARPDLLTHKVGYELLPVTVVERGTLESADNKDVVCKVKAGSRSTATTIKWVIDDGTIVSKGQLLMELDDSALQDQYRVQSIAVEKSRAEWVTADENYVITAKQNESDEASAIAGLRMAELDVEKFLGLRHDIDNLALGALMGAVSTLEERGEFKQRLDDVSSRLKLAEGDLEAYRDRAAWAARSVKLGYLTASQAKVEQSKLAGANDNVEKLRKEKFILENFHRLREHTDLSSKMEVANLGLDKAHRQAQAKLNQAESAKRTTYSVYQQELDKLRDIEDQIRECKLYAPQDGMVVYFKGESSSRYGSSSSSQGLIAVGESVKEGQKLMRIPDLKRMQVNTKVHEAMVSRIRGDDRQGTGYMDAVRAGLLAGPHGMTRLIGQSEYVLNTLREANRDKEYYLASPGQRASVRVEAFPDRVLQAHVRMVAAVASQTDFFSSDVKVYQTLVTIDESMDGLKPDMSAEVTIQVDPPKEAVLAVPIQAVVGGSEGGAKRRVYVLAPEGPQEREVVLGVFNDKRVEVREGLSEGDVVVLNPRVLLGDKAKVREEVDTSRGGRPGMGNGGKEKGKGGGKSGGKDAAKGGGGGAFPK
jgi:HlyD family secretion protein